MLKKNWLILPFLLLFVTANAYSETVVTTIFNVIESKARQKILLLSAADGRIYTTPYSDTRLRQMKSYIGLVVQLHYSRSENENAISHLEIVSEKDVGSDIIHLNYFKYNELRRFAPTDLQTYDQVDNVFNEMLNDGDKRRSQCFKRAHMWAYDMWSKLGVSSQKIFIFYTQRYIQLENFDWWFHVAPMVVANGVEYVLDGTFMDRPVTVREWQSYFINSQTTTCPVISRYQEYENNQWSRLCYLMKTPMFHFSPLDIEKRDKEGLKRNHWVLEELQDARRAFKNYNQFYEGLDTGKPTITH